MCVAVNHNRHYTSTQICMIILFHRLLLIYCMYKYIFYICVCVKYAVPSELVMYVCMYSIAAAFTKHTKNKYHTL